MRWLWIGVLVAAVTLAVVPGPYHATSVHSAPALKKKCKVVTKKVHGRKKRVKVCTAVKPTPKPKATPTDSPTLIPTATNTATPTPTLTSTLTVTATSTPTSTSTPTMPPGAPTQNVQVSASVSNPSPHQNSEETVYGRFLVSGQGVAGVPMDTAWHYRTTTSTCSGTTDASGTASCSRSISRATLGYTVSIDVVFTYGGLTYSTGTSFTPQ